jgi:RNA polymerase-binding transcription factor DksA
LKTSRAREFRSIRHKLLERRKAILEANRIARREFKALSAQDRGSEYEERAQVALADYTLYKLLEAQQQELRMIDAALRRLDEGAFGVCVDCNGEISIERLRALPYTLLCEEDARHREAERIPAGAASLPSL